MSRIVSIITGLFWAFLALAVTLAFGVFILRAARSKVPAVGQPLANLANKTTGLSV